MAINHLLREAVLNPNTNPRCAYIAPTYRQAKAVAWDYLSSLQAPYRWSGSMRPSCELICPTVRGYSFWGAENPDSLRGIYLDMAVLDEMADMPESLFPEVIRPALSDRKGKCVFIGTPRGHNAFYELFTDAESQDDWHTALFKASETGILDEEELEAAQAMMTPDQFAQEFECSWVANVPGSVFGKELQEAQEKGRIASVPYDPTCKVDTWWDLGVGDSTVVWFTQSVGRAVHVIDFYENRGEGLPHYAKMLSEKEYFYTNP